MLKPAKNVNEMITEIHNECINRRDFYSESINRHVSHTIKALQCTHEMSLAPNLQSPKWLYLQCSKCGIMIMSEEDWDKVSDADKLGMTFQRLLATIPRLG